MAAQDQNAHKGGHDKTEGPKPAEQQKADGALADHVVQVHSKQDGDLSNQLQEASKNQVNLVKDGQLVIDPAFGTGNDRGYQGNGPTDEELTKSLDDYMKNQHSGGLIINPVHELDPHVVDIPKFPEPSPGGFIPDYVKDRVTMEDFKKDVMEKFSSLSPEKQKEVDAGVEAVEKHDAKAVAKFLQSATPEQKAEFKKELEKKGYEVTEKVVSAPIGGAYVKETEITPPKGPFGHSEYEIKIRESSNGSLGPNAPPPDVKVDINLLR